MVRFNLGPMSYLVASFFHDLSKALSPGKPAIRTLQQLLLERRPERQKIYSLPADASAHAALMVMLKEHISVVTVTEPSSGHPLGLLTQGDYMRRVAAPERPARITPLRSVMTPIGQTAYCFPDNTIGDGLETLAVVGAHHIPVMTDLPENGGQLLGVVSQDELLGLTRALKAARAQKAADRVKYYSQGPPDGDLASDGYATDSLPVSPSAGLASAVPELPRLR